MLLRPAISLLLLLGGLIKPMYRHGNVGDSGTVLDIWQIESVLALHLLYLIPPYHHKMYPHLPLFVEPLACGVNELLSSKAEDSPSTFAGYVERLGERVAAATFNALDSGKKGRERWGCR